LETWKPQASFVGGVMGKKSNEFITIAEASVCLGVAQNTLRSWGAQGKIQEYRHPLNNYRLYRREDIDALATLLRSPVKVTRTVSSSSAIWLANGVVPFGRTRIQPPWKPKPLSS
jgi:DNA (cytosine-5)-methyltransferase 1